jgi:hypothetical protein
VIDAEQVWQRSDLSGADLPGPLEAASRQRLKESLVAHTHRLAAQLYVEAYRACHRSSHHNCSVERPLVIDWPPEGFLFIETDIPDV